MVTKTEQNRAHFDDEAANYDAKHEKTTGEIARRIEARRDFIGVEWIEDDSSEDEDANADATPERTVRLLDYACGTGAMSRALAPYTSQCIGIDLAGKMVDAYNARARNQGLSGDEMSAFRGDICAPSDATPEAFRDPKFFDFDVACVGLGFHHFDDPELAAERLVARLKPGGVLMIIDFLPHGPHADHDDDGHGHGHAHAHGQGDNHEKAMKTVTHHGFSEERITEIFVNAGAGKDFAIDKMGEVSLGTQHKKRELFMARGTKA